MIKRKLILIMENKPGALVRVVGLFHQRGYNIEGLHVDPVDDFSCLRGEDKSQEENGGGHVQEHDSWSVENTRYYLRPAIGKLSMIASSSSNGNYTRTFYSKCNSCICANIIAPISYCCKIDFDD